MNAPEQWQLVLDRDPLADGQFVYAVRSTGIYCRPTCPSRRPRPANVEFFSAPAEAERAGYRACLRCHPNAQRPRAAAIEAACRYLNNNAGRNVTLAELARSTGLSAFHLQRIFKQETGVSPREYHASLRAGALRANLGGAPTVLDAICDAGYSSTSRFYESAAGALGMTASAWRKGGRGAHVRYTVFRSPLGHVLLAATAKGVCFLALGDTTAEVVEELAAQFPAAQLTRDDVALAAYVEAVFAYLSGRRPQPDLPLDVQATAFQASVWRILRAIPPGATRTYSDISLELTGDTSATRAVARACATNPVSLGIPCHRVLRKGGGLAGYRWGIGRKEKLIELERRGI